MPNWPGSRMCCAAGAARSSHRWANHRRPLFDQEGILYADLDLTEVVRSKVDFDVTGHYARPDVFQLLVNEQPLPPVQIKPAED